MAISSDGCAVLLLRRSEYQLWEFARESRWELYSAEHLCSFPYWEVLWFSLIGTRNVRTLEWVTTYCDPRYTRYTFNSLKGAHSRYLPHILYPNYVRKVCYVAPNVVLLFSGKFIHVFNPSDGEIITILYFREDSEIFLNASILYLSSKRLLTFVLPNYIKCFKVHNLENLLQVFPHTLYFYTHFMFLNLRDLSSAKNNLCLVIVCVRVVYLCAAEFKPIHLPRFLLY